MRYRRIKVVLFAVSLFLVSLAKGCGTVSRGAGGIVHAK
jgi:hypothetical protein